MSHRIHSPEFLQARYRLNGHGLDSSGHLRHGTLVNAPTWGVFNRGLKTAIDLNGNNTYINCGDLACLNAVQQFTICFWMNQDVIDSSDYLFQKGSFYINTWATGNMQFAVPGLTSGRGHFDYSLVVSASNWHHCSFVFDGSQVGNANRLVIYVDAVPMTLGWTGTVPAVTADLSGADATIGLAASSFDGRLYDFRIYSCALSRDEIATVIHDPIGVL